MDGRGGAGRRYKWNGGRGKKEKTHHPERLLPTEGNSNRLYVVCVPGPVCVQVGERQNNAAHSAHMHHR